MLPLNPTLFHRLRRVFSHVLVSKAGERMAGTHSLNAEGKRRFHAVMTGEYYRVNCCYCRHVAGGDTRFRLYISYRWGVPDETGESYWWTARCFNEDCLSSPYNASDLRSRVYDGVNRSAIPQQLSAAPLILADPGPCELPGECVMLSQLGPFHDAISWLHNRKFDPCLLSEKYGVMYCVCATPKYAPATGRIVIPVYDNGELVTWQCRYPSDDANWKFIPKYYNCPDRPKRLYLYGLDHAIGHDPCVLVEGPLDVWRMGDGAVALLGKTMSDRQAEKIRRYFSFPVVMLDDDAQRNAIVVHSQLRSNGVAVKVDLPSGSPASFTSEQCWSMVADAIDKFVHEQGDLAL